MPIVNASGGSSDLLTKVINNGSDSLIIETDKDISKNSLIYYNKKRNTKKLEEILELTDECFSGSGESAFKSVSSGNYYAKDFGNIGFLYHCDNTYSKFALFNKNFCKTYDSDIFRFNNDYSPYFDTFNGIKVPGINCLFFSYEKNDGTGNRSPSYTLIYYDDECNILNAVSGRCPEAYWDNGVNVESTSPKTTEGYSSKDIRHYLLKAEVLPKDIGVFFIERKPVRGDDTYMSTQCINVVSISSISDPKGSHTLVNSTIPYCFALCKKVGTREPSDGMYKSANISDYTTRTIDDMIVSFPELYNEESNYYYFAFMDMGGGTSNSSAAVRSNSSAERSPTDYGFHVVFVTFNLTTRMATYKMYMPLDMPLIQNEYKSWHVPITDFETEKISDGKYRVIIFSTKLIGSNPAKNTDGSTQYYFYDGSRNIYLSMNVTESGITFNSTEILSNPENITNSQSYTISEKFIDMTDTLSIMVCLNSNYSPAREHKYAWLGYYNYHDNSNLYIQCYEKDPDTLKITSSSTVFKSSTKFNKITDVTKISENSLAILLQDRSGNFYEYIIEIINNTATLKSSKHIISDIYGYGVIPPNNVYRNNVLLKKKYKDKSYIFGRCYDDRLDIRKFFYYLFSFSYDNENGYKLIDYVELLSVSYKSNNSVTLFDDVASNIKSKILDSNSIGKYSGFYNIAFIENENEIDIFQASTMLNDLQNNYYKLIIDCYPVLINDDGTFSVQKKITFDDNVNRGGIDTAYFLYPFHNLGLLINGKMSTFIYKYNSLPLSKSPHNGYGISYSYLSLLNFENDKSEIITNDEYQIGYTKDGTVDGKVIVKPLLE